MHKGIATISLSGSLEEKIVAISAAKFDGIEVFDGDLVASPLRPSEVARRCADLGLTVDLFQPIRDAEGVPPEAFSGVLHRVERKLDVAEQLGATIVLVCSNATPDALDDPDLSAEQLHRVAELAGARGVTVAYEALAWGTHVSRIRDAWKVVVAADHPSLTLAVDTFHLLARGDDDAALDGVPGERIGFLQVADAPVLGLDVLQLSRHHRVFPGQGSFDIASVVGAVVEAGYRGPVSLEVFSDVVREADPHVNALDGMRSLLHLEEELRQRWSTPTEQIARPRVELFDPPPVQEPVSPAFVEVATHGSDLDSLLRAMGFGVAGRHQSKPVTWWRNGDAHVLTNESSDFEERWARAVRRPSVTGIGVAVDDVPTLAARRSALLWPRLPLRRGSDEAALEGVDSPTGVHVFVSGRSGASDDWQGDFVAESRGGSPDERGGWTGIDHVGYAVPFGLSEAEISFHRTLFGLLPGTVSEFTDPRGRMRSRVMRAPVGATGTTYGDLRVVLNVTEGASRSAGVVGLNQVAFACDDVVAAAHAMRAAGVGLLQVPDNYYDDLAARFDLPAARLAELREAGVMYDRDGDGGELLHVYTRRIAGAFYVEVLQRVGGYEGYGAPNTAVRLAAQAAQSTDARPEEARPA